MVEPEKLRTAAMRLNETRVAGAKAAAEAMVEKIMVASFILLCESDLVCLIDSHR